MMARVVGMIWLFLPGAGPLPLQTVPSTRGVPAALDPVRWVAGEPVRAGEVFRAVVTAEVAPGWHLYALDEPEGGPVALEFSVPAEGPATLESVGADRPLRTLVPGSAEPVHFYAGQARFTLRLRSRAGAAARDAVAISVRYQACNDRLCLPPRVKTLVLPDRLAAR